MARTKTVSQNMALFPSRNNSTDLDGGNIVFQILNLTSLDFSWAQNKNDVITYSKLASRERISIDPPEVNLGFSYYLGGGLNETAIGLNSSYGNLSCLLDILSGNTTDKNYFIFISPEGADAEGLNGASSGVSVIGIGNGFLNSYSLEASIGDFPTASVNVQGLNIKTYTGGVNQPVPAIYPQNGNEVTGVYFTIPTVQSNQEMFDSLSIASGFLGEPYVLRPGDISLDLSTAGGLFHNYSSIDVQSFRVGFDLNRQPLNKLGSRYSVSRELQYPVNVNFEVTMIAKDLATGSLSSFLCSTGKYNASISLKYNSCTGGGLEAFGIRLKNISLEGQNWSTQAGSDPQTVTTTWVGQIGGSGDLDNGLFLSGLTSMAIG